MGEALALASAVLFGTTHFLSGLLARRVDSAAVALLGQLGGVVLMLCLAPSFTAAAPVVDGADLAWGGLSGIGTGVGVSSVYRGMSRGQFSVVVPLSDVAAVALPVLVGVALLGDRPGAVAWCGIAAAPAALWFVSRTGHAEREGVPGEGRGGFAAGAPDGLLAGGGFALQFIGLAQIDAEAGLWPLLANRAAAILVLVPLFVRRPQRLRMPARLVWACSGAGVLGMSAITLYTLATREQLLSLTVVLTAMYPAIPVLLGVTVLRERLTRPQVLGLALAAASIGLISLA